jgi:hypothetical protein
MNFDEEEPPPLLVDVEAKDDDILEEPKQVKVPITIVTGKFIHASSYHDIDAKRQVTWELVRLL